MFAALGELFNVRFEECCIGDSERFEASVHLGVDTKDLALIRKTEHPSYTVICEDHLISCGGSPIIKFGRHDIVPSFLGGREVRSDEAVRVKGLPQRLMNVTTLASKDDTPVWVVHGTRKRHHHYSALAIPELNDDEPLYQHFQENVFLGLFPLLTFLRELTGEWRWEPPPLQACFMFDDPNLHWPTYGFINFSEIAKQANLNNYHVSFATIPLDAWFVHRPTVELFRRHEEEISLLIHGNDHIGEELAQRKSNVEQMRLLRQAIDRIEKLENRSSVEVSRLMAPPHGACTEEIIAQMARTGYEAVCVSRGSLRHYNRKANWVLTLGMRPSDMICGMTIIPRFRMSRNCENSILISAFLRQPIIPVGHHQDIAEGIEILNDLSKFINSLGDVSWANMTKISRSHYSQMIEGRTLHLRMHSNHIEVSIPEGINEVLVQRPWLEGQTDQLWFGSLEDINVVPKDFREPIAVHPCQQIRIISHKPMESADGQELREKFRPWPIMRRIITETRDRLRPNVRLFTEKSKPKPAARKQA